MGMRQPLKVVASGAAVRWRAPDRGRCPRITVELGCTDRAVDLVQEVVDRALRGGALPDSRLSARHVGDLRFALASTAKVRPVTLPREGHTVERDVSARFVTTDSAAALSAGLDGLDELDGLGIIVLAEFVASHHLG